MVPADRHSWVKAKVYERVAVENTFRKKKDEAFQKPFKGLCSQFDGDVLNKRLEETKLCYWKFKWKPGVQNQRESKEVSVGLTEEMTKDDAGRQRKSCGNGRNELTQREEWTEDEIKRRQGETP